MKPYSSVLFVEGFFFEKFGGIQASAQALHAFGLREAQLQVHQNLVFGIAMCDSLISL